MRTFSSELGTLRQPSFASGWATVLLTWVLARRWVGEWGALLAATLVALNPFQVYASNELRMYAPLAVVVVVSAVATRGLRGSGRLLLALLIASALYAPWTPFLVGLQGRNPQQWVLMPSLADQGTSRTPCPCSQHTPRGATCLTRSRITERPCSFSPICFHCSLFSCVGVWGSAPGSGPRRASGRGVAGRGGAGRSGVGGSRKAGGLPPERGVSPAPGRHCGSSRRGRAGTQTGRGEVDRGYGSGGDGGSLCCRDAQPSVRKARVRCVSVRPRGALSERAGASPGSAGLSPHGWSIRSATT